MTELQEQVLALFDRADDCSPSSPASEPEPKTAAEILRALHKSRRPAGFDQALADLVEDGRLALAREHYLPLSMVGQAAGTYWDSGRGFGFVTPDGASGRAEDVFLPPHCAGRAWHGDRVLVTLSDSQSRQGKITGRVERILQRKNLLVVGRLDKIGSEYYLTPDGGKLPELKVAGKHAGLRRGDKVQAKVTSYGSRSAGPLCTVVCSFGKDGTRQAAVESILAQNNIQRDFPQPVLEEAGRAPARVTASARKNRLDLRDKCIITIDGASAKDLDDAVSLERTECGDWLLGVHIADVSHYVKDGSPLDKEAFQRGTSVYFADQVIPMLPETLSNGICSLNPQVERLTLSCLMTISSRGEVTDHQIAKSVIKTTRRMTYADCNTLLAGSDPELEGEYSDILPMLREMQILSKRLEQLRQNRGALELETRECALVCDENGDPVDMTVRTSGVSEGIIESFMLAANETVACHLTRTGKPGVFRVHEKPSTDKLTALRGIIAPFGYQLATEDGFGMQKILRQAKGQPEESLISMAVLRAMMKARYAPENLGHFGLGAEYYCHFTSPIRRYPDLMTHRILTALLDGKCVGNKEQKLLRAARDASVQSSDREVAAETAERDIEKCYAAQLMQQHLGEVFDGAISGVSRQSLFVLLPQGIEGRVDLQWLPKDYYAYDEDKRTLTAMGSRRVYSYALPLKVKCISADPGTGEIEFQPVGEEYPDQPQLQRTHSATESGRTPTRRKPAHPAKDAHRAPARRGRGKGKRRGKH